MQPEEIKPKKKRDSLSYANCHNWLRRKHGRATRCDNPNCKIPNPQRFEWALLKGRTYSKNVEDYMQMCASCHRIYDETPERIAKIKLSQKGKVPVNRRKVVLIDVTKNTRHFFDSITEASEKLNIHKTSIHNNLAGRSKLSRGKYKCEYQ